MVTAELCKSKVRRKRRLMMSSLFEISSIPLVAGSDYGGEKFSGLGEEEAGGEDVGEGASKALWSRANSQILC
jgi:hypothetical protein